MSFTDFKIGEKVYNDPRMYPGHEEVLKFLKDFASHFELNKLIRFNTLVTRVEVVDHSSIIEFVVESNTNGVNSMEVFDAIVVCNGHNTQPQRPTDNPGIETWPRKQMHSHNYRVPEPFRDEIVVVIGSGPSALDISREIATVAKQVHMSSRSPLVKVGKSKKFNNMWQHSKIECISKDGSITFQDGFSINADVILHCTGYKLHVPFLKTNGVVSVKNKRVGPLYKHVSPHPPQLAPQLSFVGIPERSFGFLLMESQPRWIAQALSKKVLLPSKDEILSEVVKHYEEMKEKGLPEHATHQLEFQLDYLEWMWAKAGMVVEKRVKDMAEYLLHYMRTVGLDGYMDVLSQIYGRY
ncbi:flavin-containing monooxygenase FMO GS-OX-like 3 [Bidens hawaiensis]|uniref:flavin-containing monooxygenase FMO GS-OX-like 3 n=1 Tax=Bidens hawaiensis TaxID=980011 RepID=UPI0040492C92